VTQTTAATSEESAAASEELSAQAETAMDIVRQLETLVGTRGAASQRREYASAPRRHNTVTFSQPRPRQSMPVNPEEVLPLEDTGTYGRF